MALCCQNNHLKAEKYVQHTFVFISQLEFVFWVKKKDFIKKKENREREREMEGKREGRREERKEGTDTLSCFNTVQM